MSDDDRTTFSVTVKGDGVTIDREVDQGVALAVINFVMGGELPKNPGDAGGSSEEGGRRASTGSDDSSNGGSDGSVSVGEFIHDVEAKRNADKVAAIAVFMKRYEGLDRFTRPNVESRFQAAGEPPPKNFSRDFNLAVQAKWVAQTTDNKNEFFVTGSGEKVVDAHFPKADKKKASASASRRRTRKKNTGNGDAEATG